MPVTPLSMFAPPVAEWFASTHSQPTETQQRAWPVIARGENLLVTAPTGGGKTLAAFLWTINQLVTGHWPDNQLAAVYVSPLKALNNDIRENLLTPLAEISEIASREGVVLHSPRIAVRSGDSTPAERRKIWTSHPEILITTPESLFLMLQSQQSLVKSLFASVKTVIVDEVHAMLNTRRGVQLAASLEMLGEFAGEFQRIALSATVKPVTVAAAFIGGSSARTTPPSPRPVTIVECPNTRQLDIAVQLLPPFDSTVYDDNAWKRVAQIIIPHLQNNRSTLVFCNARNTCEKIAHSINDGHSDLLAFSHHGSLSKEIRQTVEKRMKAGELKAIVATSSLELGIDIGAIDEVILVNAPSSIAAATQRIGRAGHHVGAVSRALLLVTHPHELLQALAVRNAVLDKDIEPSQPPQNCLDVLAQIILAVALHTPRQLDWLYNFITSIWSYRNLPRRHFDSVVQLLAGRFENLSVTTLRPKLNIDQDTMTCLTRHEASTALKLSSGTIPDRGLYKLRQSNDNALVGELDEEFVWEARIGQRFTLGTQAWAIDRITHDDVFVSPVASTADVPFWKAEPQDRPYELSSRIAAMLAQWDALLEKESLESLVSYLIYKEKLSTEDAFQLAEYLQSQKNATGFLPNSSHILIEHVQSIDEEGEELYQTVLHTFWGGRVNRPLSIAIRAACHSVGGLHDADIIANNDGIWISAPTPIDKHNLLDALNAENIEAFVIQGLQDSAFFAAHFREAAGRAILLPKGLPGKRKPLWMTRLRAQKLWDEIASFPDFPIAIEAWRSCLQDDFDLPHLRQILTEIQEGAIRVTEISHDIASPFARQARWSQINTYMYDSDKTPAPAAPNDKWLADLLGTQVISISLSLETIQTFEAKRKGLAVGYAPSSAAELQNAIHDRWCLPASEWTQLQDAIHRDFPEEAEAILDVDITEFTSSESTTFIGDAENVREIQTFPLHDTPRLASRLRQILQYLGPQTIPDFLALIPLPTNAVRSTLQKLLESNVLLEGDFTTALPAPQICLRDNLERLVRTERNARRLLDFKPVQPLAYQAWLANNFAVTSKDASRQDSLKQFLLKLTGLPLKIDSLETTILPARFPDYDPLWLDSQLSDGILAIGASVQSKCLRFVQETDLTYLQKPAEPAGNWPETTFSLDTFLRPENYSAMATVNVHAEFIKGFLNGEITPDTFRPLRLLAESTAAKQPLVRQTRPVSSHRRHMAMYNSSRFNAANITTWRKTPWPDKMDDPIEAIEQDKERVRILLDRYGVLFKALLEKESPEFRWSRLFPALRLLELSGEIVSGHFIDEITTLQFAALDTLDSLKRSSPSGVVWFQATDPASLCGITSSFATPPFPTVRRDSTFIVMENGQIVLVATNSGRHVLLTNAERQPSPAWFAPWHTALHRRISPVSSLEIQSVNGQPATAFLPRQLLEVSFMVEKNMNKWILYRK